MIELRPPTDEPISRCARCGGGEFDYVDADDLEAGWMLPDALRPARRFLRRTGYLLVSYLRPAALLSGIEHDRCRCR